MKRISVLLLLLLSVTLVSAQAKKTVYHPCFLLDSVDKHLVFIQQNTYRIFQDTFDCRQSLLDSIAVKYLRSKDKKYLDALSNIRNYGGERVENLYTDIMKRMAEKDFTGFINDLYLAKGKYASLEKELIATMNMMIDGRPYKQKYMGILNVQITKATDAKDKYKLYYLEKLKTKIEEEKYH